MHNDDHTYTLALHFNDTCVLVMLLFQELEEIMYTLKEKNMFEMIITLLEMLQESYVHLREGIDKLDSSEWDIVLVDQAFIYLSRYISIKWPDTPVILHVSTQPLFDDPTEIPAFADYPEDMTFFQRFMNALVYGKLVKIVLWFSWRSMLNYDNELAEVLGGEPCPYFTAGIANPFISTTTFGFEFPIPLLPMVHLTGPHLIKAVPPIGEDLEQWLSRKREKKVVYISMGSAAFLTKEMGEGLIEGITAAGYDAVWSLRESNQDILEGIELDREHFYVSSWISQQAVLQHKAIGIAILHGGMNGVHEAIYYKVPVIVIPFGLDQPLLASRIHHRKLGVRLFSAEVTAERVSSSIHAVETGDYRERVEKLSEIFRFAGGTKKAADILEHYVDVGYDHLTPAFYKYKWSWVQYYNADVYALLIGILVVTAYCFYRIMKFTCGKCFGSKSKTD